MDQLTGATIEVEHFGASVFMNDGASQTEDLSNLLGLEFPSQDELYDSSYSSKPCALSSGVA